MVTVLAAAMAAVAQPQTQSQSQTNATVISATVNKPVAEKKVEIFTPFSKKFPPSKQTDKVVRVNGESSQPWSRMIGTKPGWSAFPDPERQDSTLNLFWIGAAPSR